MLTNLPTLYHDKAYAETPPLGPEADEDVHFLPAEPMTNAQKSQETADVLDLFTRINPSKETRKVEVNMAEVSCFLSLYYLKPSFDEKIGWARTATRLCPVRRISFTLQFV